MRNIIAGALFALGTLTMATPAVALDESERKEVETIVRDYLLANPEILIEVQEALQRKGEEEARKRATAALSANREAIFESRHQAELGNREGDVTVVEFFDYNCSYCRRALDDMQAIIESDPKVRFVMKELPILSAQSLEAARVSTAVYRLFPESYRDFHSKLLAAEGMKDGDLAYSVAGDMGIDIEALKAEAQKPELIEALGEPRALAEALGINGTPSYVVGDEVVFGALGADVLREKIANMRKCGSATCG